VNEVSNLLTYVVVKIPATPSNVCDAFFLGGGQDSYVGGTVCRRWCCWIKRCSVYRLSIVTMRIARAGGLATVRNAHIWGRRQ